MKKIKKALGYIISILPTNGLRVFLYRIIFNYNIKKSKIGWGTVIIIEKADLTNSVIGKKNKFIGPLHLTLKKGASIGDDNIFHCGAWTADVSTYTGYDRKITLEENSRISGKHYIDVAGSILVGQNTLFAGRYSQLWTHGASVKKRNITIGANCYIGSAVKIKPGVTIGDNCIVGIGSVITKDFTKSNLLIGGNPAVIIKDNYSWK